MIIMYDQRPWKVNLQCHSWDKTCVFSGWWQTTVSDKVHIPIYTTVICVYITNYSLDNLVVQKNHNPHFRVGREGRLFMVFDCAWMDYNLTFILDWYCIHTQSDLSGSCYSSTYCHSNILLLISRPCRLFPFVVASLSENCITIMLHEKVQSMKQVVNNNLLVQYWYVKRCNMECSISITVYKFSEQDEHNAQVVGVRSSGGGGAGGCGCSELPGTAATSCTWTHAPQETFQRIYLPASPTHRHREGGQAL